ncbi:MAG: sialate O-acetylesterase [Victivallaceae bacterium]|jgi:sialate O-acetylesterase
MRRFGLLVASLVTAAVLTGCCSWFCQEKMAGSFTVHKVYGDHMVLQRERPVRISGNCPAGEAVKVTLGSNSVYAVADAKGEWVATLPAMKAGGPYVATVEGKAGKSKETFSDVLIGEVWICSGQSNMEFRLKSCNDAEKEIANASHPGIRLFNTTANRSVSPVGPRHEIAGPGWQVCTPKSAADFSGAGYFFGRQLHQDLNVPVGLINSSWGGTPIESWISLEGYQSAGRTKELSTISTADKKNVEAEAKVQKIKADYDRKFKEWEAIFFGKYKSETAKAVNWKDQSLDMTGWEKVNLPGTVDDPGIDGVIWVRRTFDVPADWADRNLVLSLGSVDDCDQTFFNGELVGSTGSDVPMYWSAPRVYNVPGRLVKAGANTIAIRIIDYAYAGGVNGQMTLAPAADKTKKLDLAGTWNKRIEFAIDPRAIPERPNVAAAIPGDVKSPNFPATLYNSMIAPWTVYPMRGAIWYQGESNAGNAQDYMILHQLLIKNWRTLWNDPEFGFFFVQLAGYEQHTPKNRLPDNFWKGREPRDPAWPKLREVQTATLNIPNTGMAVTIDIGDHSDIHPTNKQDVGLRLAKEAERVMYGMNIVSAGPMFEKMQVENGRIRIFYKNTGSGLVAKGGALGHFAIAGADGKFVWARAAIDGGTVIVESDKVKSPVHVRYAWEMYPIEANLYNKEGFPACPFRTDEANYLLKK